MPHAGALSGAASPSSSYRINHRRRACYATSRFVESGCDGHLVGGRRDLGVVTEGGTEHLASSVEAAHHRAHGDAHAFGRIAVGHLSEVDEFYGATEALGEICERAADRRRDMLYRLGRARHRPRVGIGGEPRDGVALSAK